MRAKFPGITHLQAVMARSPLIRPCGPPSPMGGRLLAEASPVGGKLSPKVTDEGRVAVAAHLPGNDGRSALIQPCGPPSPEGEGF